MSEAQLYQRGNFPPTHPPAAQPLRAHRLLAGEVGIEPTNAGIKIRCLTTWRLPNLTLQKTKIRLPVRQSTGHPIVQRMPCQTLRDYPAHFVRQLPYYPFGLAAVGKFGEYAGARPGHHRFAEIFKP